MPCVGRPCASACTRWRAAAAAISGCAPARSIAAHASRNSSCGAFFIATILTGSPFEESAMGKMIELTASDGHKLSAYRADPAGKSAAAGKPRGAIVVIQEIFGVNSHIKQVADGYAADGYVAIAPALFDRVKPAVD